MTGALVGGREAATKAHIGIAALIDDVGVVESEFARAMEHVLDRLNAEHAAVILVGHFVLPAPEPAPAPDVVLLEPRQRLGQRLVPVQRWRRVAVLHSPALHELSKGVHSATNAGGAWYGKKEGPEQVPVREGDNLILWLNQSRSYCPTQRFQHHGGPSPGTPDLHYILLPGMNAAISGSLGMGFMI